MSNKRLKKKPKAKQKMKQPKYYNALNDPTFNKLVAAMSQDDPIPVFNSIGGKYFSYEVDKGRII